MPRALTHGTGALLGRLLHLEAPLEHVGGSHRIFARETRIAILRRIGVAALRLAHGAVEPVERDEPQRRDAEMVAHLFLGHGGGQQFLPLRRVDAVETGPGGRRDAMRKCTSAAPASRIISLILREVVPRTTLSSTRITRLPRINARFTLSFSRTPMLRICSVGSMKVRPMYWLRMIPIA